jgi:ferredoxin
MPKRKIINIDESKCDGCGLCMPNCPEGALKIIDGKARLISDLFCDGLGACIRHCPKGAIAIEEREAEKYDERKVMENIVKQGKNVIREHLEHLKSHKEDVYLKEAAEFLKERGIETPKGGFTGHGHGFSGCPGSRVFDLRSRSADEKAAHPAGRIASELGQWPVQLSLVPVNAPYFSKADLLIAADCVPFAYPDFHRVLLKGKTLLVGCPKLDDVELYKEKISQILKMNSVKSVTYAHMEVPCCFGLVSVIKEAIERSGKDIPFKDVTVSLNGELSE